MIDKMEIAIITGAKTRAGYKVCPVLMPEIARMRMRPTGATKLPG
jgi:hypothetical protein